MELFFCTIVLVEEKQLGGPKSADDRLVSRVDGTLLEQLSQEKERALMVTYRTEDPCQLQLVEVSDPLGGRFGVESGQPLLRQQDLTGLSQGSGLQDPEERLSPRSAPGIEPDTSAPSAESAECSSSSTGIDITKDLPLDPAEASPNDQDGDDGTQDSCPGTDEKEGPGDTDDQNRSTPEREKDERPPVQILIDEGIGDVGDRG